MKKLLALSFVTICFCAGAFAQEKLKRAPKKITPSTVKVDPAAPQTDAQKAAASRKAIKEAEAAKKH